MRITSNQSETYTPKAMDNRKLPKGEQVVAELRHLSIEEYEPIAKDAVAILSRCVIGLKNLVVNGQPVADGLALVALPRRDAGVLAAELYLHLVSYAEIPAEAEKNSGSRPSSSSEEPRTTT